MNEVKAYLLQYSRVVERIRQAEKEIAEISATLDSISTKSDGMPRSTNISDRTGALAVQLADARAKQTAILLEAWRKRDEIEQVINAVPEPTHSRLLYDRYVALMPWREIAADIYADEVYTRGQLHGAALESARPLLPK